MPIGLLFPGENTMPRSLLLPFVLLVAIFCAAALLLSPVPAPAGAAAPFRAGAADAQGGPRIVPAATCDFTPLSFTFSGPGPIEASRPFPVSAGDTFEQFIAPPITATTVSTASLILNNGFAGTLANGITGSFVMTNLNGLLITSPGGAGT